MRAGVANLSKRLGGVSAWENPADRYDDARNALELAETLRTAFNYSAKGEFKVLVHHPS